MKNLILGTVLGLTLLAGSAQAEMKGDTYIAYENAQLISESSKLFGAQPIDEILGGDSMVHKLKYGAATEDWRIFWLGSVAPEKNNEIILGFGADWIHKINDNFSWYLGTEVGMGRQNVKGDTANVSTNATKVSYVISGISSQTYTPTQIKYEDNTELLTIGLTLGTTYKLSKNLDLSAQYNYRYDTYQVAYRNQDDTTILNSMTVKQDNHTFGLSLAYKF